MRAVMSNVSTNTDLLCSYDTDLEDRPIYSRNEKNVVRGRIENEKNSLPILVDAQVDAARPKCPDQTIFERTHVLGVLELHGLEKASKAL